MEKCKSTCTPAKKAYPCQKKEGHAGDHKNGILTWDTESEDK